MKRLLVTAVLALATTAAIAADLPYRKEPPAYIPPPPPPPMWTGFYAGLNAGGGFGGASGVTTSSAPLLDAVASKANNLDPPHIIPGFGPSGQIPGTGLVGGTTALANSGVANVNRSGFIGGGQIGYNYQWGQSFVAGIEADIQGSTMKGSGSYTGASQDSIAWKDFLFTNFGDPITNQFGAYTAFSGPCSINGCNLIRTAQGFGRVTSGVDWMGTVRGRLGYLFTPTMLIYGTGGLAYGGVQGSATHGGVIQASLTGLNNWSPNNPAGPPLPLSLINGTYSFPLTAGAGNRSDTRVGWIAGGGVEWMFLPNWSLKVEGLYYDLGKADILSSPVILTSPRSISIGGLSATAGEALIANAPVTRIKNDGVIVRAGVNYHLIW